MTSIPTPLVARFIRNYKSVYGVISSGDPREGVKACTTRSRHVADAQEDHRKVLG
jgi:hypothetical protein